MIDFRENHFYIEGAGFLSRGSLIEWDRAVIGPAIRRAGGCVVRILLHGNASPELRAAMRAHRPVRSAARGTAARHQSLRDLVALALGSPEFQRR